MRMKQLRHMQGMVQSSRNGRFGRVLGLSLSIDYKEVKCLASRMFSLGNVCH